MSRASPSSSRYSNSFCPGKSCTLPTIFVIRRSLYVAVLFGSAFSLKTKTQFRTVYIHMPALHRRQAKRFVVARVLFITDTNKCLLQQLDNGGEHFVLLQAGQSKICFHAFANLGQC